MYRVPPLRHVVHTRPSYLVWLFSPDGKACPVTFLVMSRVWPEQVGSRFAVLYIIICRRRDLLASSSPFCFAIDLRVSLSLLILCLILFMSLHSLVMVVPHSV